MFNFFHNIAAGIAVGISSVLLLFSGATTTPNPIIITQPATTTQLDGSYYSDGEYHTFPNGVPTSQPATSPITPVKQNVIPSVTTPTCTANSAYNGSQCVCNTGYFSDNGTCITSAESCIKSYGVHSIPTGQLNAQGGSICNCASGYQWNSSNTTCIPNVAQAVPQNSGQQTTQLPPPTSDELAGVYRMCAAVPQTCSSPIFWPDYDNDANFRAAIDAIVLHAYSTQTQKNPTPTYIAPTLAPAAPLLQFQQPTNLHCTSSVSPGGYVETNCY